MRAAPSPLPAAPPLAAIITSSSVLGTSMSSAWCCVASSCCCVASPLPSSLSKSSSSSHARCRASSRSAACCRRAAFCTAPSSCPTAAPPASAAPLPLLLHIPWLDMAAARLLGAMAATPCAAALPRAARAAAATAARPVLHSLVGSIVGCAQAAEKREGPLRAPPTALAASTTHHRHATQRQPRQTQHDGQHHQQRPCREGLALQAVLRQVRRQVRRDGDAKGCGAVLGCCWAAGLRCAVASTQHPLHCLLPPAAPSCPLAPAAAACTALCTCYQVMWLTAASAGPHLAPPAPPRHARMAPAPPPLPATPRSVTPTALHSGPRHPHPARQWPGQARGRLRGPRHAQVQARQVQRQPGHV